MDAKEYLKKAIAMCKVYDDQGRCDECPLHKLSCGLPKDEAGWDEVIRVVEEFKEPTGPYICPQCQNEDHPADARFCKICGKKIEGR